MKNRKNTIVFSIVILLILGVIGIIYLKPSSDLSSRNKNIIGEQDITKSSYGYPLIGLLSYNNGTLNIDAGIYRYGDINQDGIVGNKDINFLRIMISTDKMGFSNGQVKLADINEDGKINNNDIKLFEQYLKKNGEVKYSINSNLLSYCVSTTNNHKSCSWHKKHQFNVEKGKNYYVFVKQNSNNRISESVLFSKDSMEELID